MAVDRQTVDLSAYPDLVVFYLGIRVRRPRGMLRLFGLKPRIQKSWKAQPDGLLLHVHLVANPAARWDAPVLARPRQPGALEPLGAARNRPLARDLLHGRRHGSDLRRHEPTDRPGPLRPGAASARRNVLGAAQGRAQRAVDGRTRDHRGGVLPRLASRPAALNLRACMRNPVHDVVAGQSPRQTAFESLPRRAFVVPSGFSVADYYY
jgi:hypothetical protein